MGLLAATVAVMAIAPARAAEAPMEPDCYDAVVMARYGKQTPSPIPPCDDCIVMTWPWDVDLQVERVLAGRMEPGFLKVQTIQHTYRRNLLVKLWLRRNTLGGFNMMPWTAETPVYRCRGGKAPAAAFDGRPREP